MEDEQKLDKWKEEVFFQTQGFVDVDQSYPKLGRYLGLGFFKDQVWWDKARELLTPAENEWINRRYDNLFSPSVLLFADKTVQSRIFFDLLMDGEISLRVLPTDDHIKEPTVGSRHFDLLFKNEEEIRKYIDFESTFKKEIRRFANNTKNLVKPDPLFATLMEKVRQIQIERAIVEMSRVMRD